MFCFVLFFLSNFAVNQNKPPDWQDFIGIITLLVINSPISFIEENNAGKAAAALMARLAPKAKVISSATYLPHYAASVCLHVGFQLRCPNPHSSFTSLNFSVIIQILRDGRWTEEDAAILVPGDVISIKLGDIIPADALKRAIRRMMVSMKVCLGMLFSASS